MSLTVRLQAILPLMLGPVALVVALVMVLVVALGATEARADFGDCAASGYLYSVDDRMSGIALDCDEAVRFTIATPLGTRNVRIIYDTGDLRAGLPDQIATLRRAIEQSAAALRAIGEGGTNDITIWASNLPVQRTPTGDVEGEAGRVGDECVIAAYEAPNIEWVMAHEFFHCVQFATFGRDKVYMSASSWWVEGAAEWFANVVHPGTGNSDGYVSGFDAATNRTALTDLEYESVVFFFWLSQTYGASMVMAVQAAMPSGGGGGAQQDALAGMLPPEDFAQFAQAYADREIRQPGGRAVPVNPTPAHIYVWQESATREIETGRFVLVFEHLEFACGTWNIERETDRGEWHISRRDGPWEDMPERLEIDEPGPEVIRLTGMAVADPSFAVSIRAERNACEQCGTPRPDDDVMSCLVGTWNLVSGGYGEQIQQSLEATGFYDSIEYPALEPILILYADGTFSMPASDEDYNAVIVQDDGDVFQGIGTLSLESGGHWSVDGDILHTCEAGPHLAEIDLTIIDPEGNSDNLVTAGSPPSGGVMRSREFTCAGGQLVLIERAPFVGDVTWVYSR